MFKCRLLTLLKQRLKIRYASQVCHPVDPIDPGTKVTVLTNGVRIATEVKPSPLACISLFCDAGSRYETACNNGICHFLEHMAYKGLCSMNQSALEEALFFMGAKMTAETTREYQSFTARCPSEFAPNIVDILGGIMTDLELSNRAIDIEKHNICLEMVDTDNDARAVMFDYLHQTAFQGTPLAQRVIGPSKNYQKFDREFAVDFLCRHYQPYKLCVVSSGQLKHDEMVRFVESKLGHLVGEEPCDDEGPCRFTGSQIIYRDDSMPFAHVAVAFEAPGLTSPEYLTLLVASYMLGEWHKSQGGSLTNGPPLARAAAHDDLCESYEAFYIAYRDIGLWGVYFVSKQMDLEDMLANVQDQLMKICLMTQYTDLERALNMAKMKIARSMDGCINSCNDIGHQLLYTCTRQSLVDRFHNLSQIKHHAIRESVERIVYDRCPAVAAVGPTENLPDYTRIRAGQYWLRL